MIALDQLQRWLDGVPETEHLEFKEAKQHYEIVKLFKYCVALANEGGGYLVLGVSDKLPRQVVNTKAFLNIGETKSKMLKALNFRVDIQELQHPDGRVLVFQIPSRPTGQPLNFEGAYLMRVGEQLSPMTPDQLRRIFDEGAPDWFSLAAKVDAGPDDVVALLDTQALFDLMGLPYPTSRDGVLERLASEGLIYAKDGGWIITNLAAVLIAKRLDAFSPELARKAPRVVIYEGVNKLETRNERTGLQGYAIGFEGLLGFVHSSASKNHFVEQVVREEVKMFPRQALRELIANALVHQDFSITGASVMIEMYSDRVEISNPGIPTIKIDRFIDEFRSRNERLADFMRRLGICEEKGSGIDKVVQAAERYLLPAPDFRVGETRTAAILFAHKDFSDMSKTDRIRACYQHCCLLYVSNQSMSNQTLRERFKVTESKAASVSLVISATREAGFIKQDDSESNSTRYARYLPYWA